ncbi:MAG: manganese ABC transporter ATP-binding protein [Deltaproteobacteria bacterium]|nr:MAG: manganese ABC transporter ATP-binding protein [Deltaproteobacteria bacterium]
MTGTGISTRTNSGPRVSFETVGLFLGGNCILRDINFTVDPGSIHCIIGPNGGGKTSLIRSLVGQMPHDGTIRIDWPGDRITGYVPQALDFDRTLPMTVDDFMTLICQNRPVFSGMSQITRNVIDRALDQVGMIEKRNYRFGGLSGGERQRVLLAQALIPRPALLILDEPASGLDRTGTEVMHSLLKTLKSEGTTILMIHHDLAEVKALADAVTCINQHVLFSGDPGLMLTPEAIFTVFSSRLEV